MVSINPKSYECFDLAIPLLDYVSLKLEQNIWNRNMVHGLNTPSIHIVCVCLLSQAWMRPSQQGLLAMYLLRKCIWREVKLGSKSLSGAVGGVWKSDSQKHSRNPNFPHQSPLYLKCWRGPIIVAWNNAPGPSLVLFFHWQQKHDFCPSSPSGQIGSVWCCCLSLLGK